MFQTTCRLFVSDVNAAFNQLLPFIPNCLNFASKGVNVGCFEMKSMIYEFNFSRLSHQLLLLYLKILRCSILNAGSLILCLFKELSCAR